MHWERQIGKLGANRTQNYPLWLCPLNNETAYHHVITCLHKAARTDIAQS